MPMSLFSGLSRIARTISPMRVAPGSWTARTGMFACSSRSRSRRAWVDFPHPSPPSKTMNLPRRLVMDLQFAICDLQLKTSQVSRGRGFARFAQGDAALVPRCALPWRERAHYIAHCHLQIANRKLQISHLFDADVFEFDFGAVAQEADVAAVAA